LASQKGKNEMAQSLYNAFDIFYRKQKAAAVQGAEDAEVPEKSENSEKLESTPRYAIQICASKEPLAKNDPKLKGLDAQYFQQNNYYKYYCFPSVSRDSVAQHLPAVKQLVPDAWIIKLP
ncbi:MAG: hypothetical protein ACI4TV_05740, partial [Paludibacteraceae bacterium]